MYSVFYLTGGSKNFVSKKVFGEFDWEQAKKEVESLQNMGYKAMAVKNGHIIGGYCSYSDFDTPEESEDYYRGLS